MAHGGQVQTLAAWNPRLLRRKLQSRGSHGAVALCPPDPNQDSVCTGMAHTLTQRPLDQSDSFEVDQGTTDTGRHPGAKLGVEEFTGDPTQGAATMAQAAQPQPDAAPPQQSARGRAHRVWGPRSPQDQSPSLPCQFQTLIWSRTWAELLWSETEMLGPSPTSMDPPRESEDHNPPGLESYRDDECGLGRDLPTSVGCASHSPPPGLATLSSGSR